jgi:predicted flap endonuclease-1-like 5' DNA nuclease
MTNLAHITETALLLLAAYLLGCFVGYGIRLVLHAGRGTRRVAPPAAAVAAPTPEPYKPRSTAARLAASVEVLPRDIAPAPLPATAIEASAAPAKSAEVTKIVPMPTDTAAAAQPSTKPPRKTKSADPKPAALAHPRAGGADNLKQIKGIGPKIEASLYAMGIFHIDQIAGWSKANIEWVDAQLSFKGRIRRERWVEQAQELGSKKTVA